MERWNWRMSREDLLGRKFVDSNVFLYVLRADPSSGRGLRSSSEREGW